MGIKLVSWGFAFRKGFVILLWTLLWGILGGIIAIVVSGGAIIAAIMSGTVEGIVGAFATIIVGSIVGMLVSSIGAYATIVKVTVESTLEQQGKMGTRMCPQCGRTIVVRKNHYGDPHKCPKCNVPYRPRLQKIRFYS